MENFLNMRELALSFVDTGYFKIQCDVTARESFEKVYTATILGESVLGSIALRSGIQRFSLYSKPIDTTLTIINDSYLPMKIQTGEYSGFYGGRYSRI